MIPRPLPSLILILVLVIASMARAGDETSAVVEATKLLEEIASKPDSGIPARFLREAKGVLIMPHMVESMTGLGRKQGRGVFLSRGENGGWDDPELVRSWGVGLGLQAGLLVTDSIVIYRTLEAADAHGRFLIGADVRWTIIKHRDRFRGPNVSASDHESVLVYTRKQGVLLAARVGVEITTDTSTPPVSIQLISDANKTRAGSDGPAKGAKLDPAVSQAKAKPVSVSPEVARLKSTLTAMTKPSPAKVAETPTKDPKVRLPSGPRPRTDTASASGSIDPGTVRNP